ncbi:MAG: histidine kinase [Corynebacterium sp.]|uniref:sensor histidine kinase n=2 Tax=Corynebacterium sp. TaxID=1720 RepID=UPI0026478B25|nr:histidine kinase [Corynebacterium sp.]MDN6281758.1 histidine kinase [Corynebacterium sp.]
MNRRNSPAERTVTALGQVGQRTRTPHTVVGRTARRFGVSVFVVLFAAILYAVAWPTSFVTHEYFGSAHAALIPVIAAFGTWPVATSVRWPFWSWLSVAAVCLISVPFRDNMEFALGWPVAFHLALAFTLAMVVLKASDGALIAAVAGTGLVMAFNPAEVRIGWLVGVFAWTVLFLLVRWLVASRKELATSTESLRQESTRASEQSQLRVMAEERNRLTRDLHDVVAHQMSMIVVQSQSAPYRLQGVTPAIHAEFDSLSATAREALNQVRELLGVLRTDAETGTTTPVGADQIEPMLTSARRAGMDVIWTLDPATATIDDTAGVVLQRVLQESLSNATRHAPGGKVLVNLELSDGSDVGDADGNAAGSAGAWANLTVDNGPAAEGEIVLPEHSGGSGIQGMSARVRAVGGSFTALPASDGGFTGTAGVPVRGR